jgi:hypothetical protein
LLLLAANAAHDIMWRLATLLLLAAAQWADCYVTLAAARPLRAAAPRMESGGWPPPLDFVHMFRVDFGGTRKARLALTPVSNEKRAVLMSLWRFMYEHEAQGGDAEAVARTGDELRAELSLAADASGKAFGAYLDGEVDGDEHGIALVRFEDEFESSKRQVMIIDKVMVSPALPPQYRPPLEAAVVQSLRVIGEANEMNVRLWTDFDV